MSYCVTDGDEPAKAPEAKKKTVLPLNETKVISPYKVSALPFNISDGVAFPVQCPW